MRNYENQLTAVYWTTQQENQKLVMIGDECGNVLTVDPRVPNKILNKQKVSNRAITMFCFNGTRIFGVAAETATVKLCELDGKGSFETILEHTSPSLVFSICCDSEDKKTFYVVGEHKYGEKLTIPS